MMEDVSKPIPERLATAQADANPQVIARMPSGWATLCDRQFPAGWCVLIADPLVASLNDLDAAGREAFLADMARLGDALLDVTPAARVNYAVYCNQDPYLHAHVIPRYSEEGPAMRLQPVWTYPNEKLDGRPFDAKRDRQLMEAIREFLDGGNDS